VDGVYYVYHLVTRKKMALGQVLNFDKNEANNLYRFFFERDWKKFSRRRLYENYL